MKTESILSITNNEQFEAAALELFRFQSVNCAPYHEFIALAGIDPRGVDSIGKIPFLPVSLFKTQRLYCSTQQPEVVFTSSTTTGQTPSRHYVKSLSDYEKIFTAAFEMFYGEYAPLRIYALLPGYLERSDSSLVYMADRLISRYGGDFYLNEYEKLIEDIKAYDGRKILLGVSYALWELAEKHPGRLQNTIIMETGGMKGRREELPREEFHKILCTSFGVSSIHSEYGMAELSSQAYSRGNGLFSTPPWMKVLIRDPNDPFELLRVGSAGALNIIDLGNLNSCAFLQTEDLGRVDEKGQFMILGRVDRSEIRGCNLLLQ